MRRPRQGRLTSQPMRDAPPAEVRMVLRGVAAECLAGRAPTTPLADAAGNRVVVPMAGEVRGCVPMPVVRKEGARTSRAERAHRAVFRERRRASRAQSW